MAAREIECDAEITCQSDNFHRSDIQDIFFLSSHRTVVEHLSSTSSKKRPAGIRTCGCRAQRLQRAQRTSDTPANFVDRHFFLLMRAFQRGDSFVTTYILGPFQAHIAKSRKENPFHLGTLRRLNEGMPIRIGAERSPSPAQPATSKEVVMVDVSIIPMSSTSSKLRATRQVPANQMNTAQHQVI